MVSVLRMESVMITNPYSPPTHDLLNGGSDPFLWKRLPVFMSWLLASVTACYVLGAILLAVAYLSSPVPSPEIQKWLIPRLSIGLLLATVSSLINSLAAFRWKQGHWVRGLLYNAVAIAVIVGPLSVIPWKLLTLIRS
jgi:hypothetical protein